MKRYMLFCFDDYEAHGGINDLAGVHETIDDCMYIYSEIYKELMSEEEYHIYDLEQMKIVKEGDYEDVENK